MVASKRRIKIRRRPDKDGSPDKKKSGRDTARLEKSFGSKKFDIEHALTMQTRSYVQMPATSLYDKELLEAYRDEISKCHVYLVGTLPMIISVGAKQSGRTVVATFQSLGKRYKVHLSMPDGTSFVDDGGGAWHLTDKRGGKAYPGRGQTILALREIGLQYDFEVLYIGQAFGKNGSRHAVDRLLKHETLQKIAIHGAPTGYELVLLLLQIAPSTGLITMINPFAKNTKDSDKRIDDGLYVLRHTTEAQRTSLFEASLIRYFQPEANDRLKDSFPSTNMMQPRMCYKKDIAAVSAEVDLQGAPFRLYSPMKRAKEYHLAYHDLHDDDARKVFFLGPAKK